MSRTVKTHTLSGRALDWAVAQAVGEALVDGCLFTKDPFDEQVLYTPSTNWAQAGPIIEEHRVCLLVGHSGVWLAYTRQNYGDERENMQAASEPLVAAMRSVVEMRFGRRLELPTELLT